MNTEQLYEIFLKHPAIFTDSRKITPSGIFFALRGANFNGNQFIKKALDQGAAWAVADEKQDGADNRIIYVEDTLTALQQLATHHRKVLGLPVVAITGSNGKTTTKELTANVLKQRYNISFTQGNLNNHIGVPLTLLSFSNETEIGVVEMGANHPGEIAALSRIAQPDYGLITNVGKAHLEGFGSFEGVILTKTELYRYLEATGGSAFINSGNHWLTESAGKTLSLITYGQSHDCWISGEQLPSEPYLSLRIFFQEGPLDIQTNLTGSYNLENVLAAAAIGKHFNIPSGQIQQGIESYIPSNNRSQLIEAGTNHIYMDAYNANPTSMQASIENFLSAKYPKSMVILGDMLELGIYSREEHQKIADRLSQVPNLKVILVGPAFGETKMPGHFMSFPNTEQASLYLEKDKPRDYRILIKGSRGIGLENIVTALY